MCDFTLEFTYLKLKKLSGAQSVDLQERHQYIKT